MGETSITKIDTNIEAQVVAMTVNGETQKTIIARLKNGGVEISLRQVKKIRKDNEVIIKQTRDELSAHEATVRKRILNKTLALTQKRVETAEGDEDKLRELQQKYRSKKINKDQYERGRRGLVELTVRELMDISKEMSVQIKEAKESGIPDDNTADPAAIQELAEAIKRGDQVELQRIIFKPTAGA